jgi:hypothetical protein
MNVVTIPAVRPAGAATAGFITTAYGIPAVAIRRFPKFAMGRIIPTAATIRATVNKLVLMASARTAAATRTRPVAMASAIMFIPKNVVRIFFPAIYAIKTRAVVAASAMTQQLNNVVMLLWLVIIYVISTEPAVTATAVTQTIASYATDTAHAGLVNISICFAAMTAVTTKNFLA